MRGVVRFCGGKDGAAGLHQSYRYYVACSIPALRGAAASAAEINVLSGSAVTPIEHDAGSAFVRFITSPGAKMIWKAEGFEAP